MDQAISGSAPSIGDPWIPYSPPRPLIGTLDTSIVEPAMSTWPHSPSWLCPPSHAHPASSKGNYNADMALN